MKANNQSIACLGRYSRNALTAALVTSVLAACSGSVIPPTTPPPPPTTQPTPRPQVQPIRPSADWRQAPQTLGTWRMSRDNQGPIASFGNGLVDMRCSLNSRTITFTRNTPSANQHDSITIATSATNRTLAAHASNSGLGFTLPASDPLWDAMTFSRGRFSVETPGLDRLIIPSWSEVGKLVQDCR